MHVKNLSKKIKNHRCIKETASASEPNLEVAICQRQQNPMTIAFVFVAISFYDFVV